MEPLDPLPWQRAQWEQLLAWRRALPHALLLHGARGIGKRRLADAFARLLLCEAPGEQGACRVCASCLLQAADNHPDLRRLMPAAELTRDDVADTDSELASGGAKTAKPSREIVIDQVRALGEFLSLSAHRGGRRVVLLAPAEALNHSAANALLKLLEEPPPGAFFVAVTDRLDAVLPTIVSRCVLLRVTAPTPAESLAWLQAQGVSDAAARLAEAGGAPVGLEHEDDPQGLPAAQREALLQLLRRGGKVTAADVVAAIGREAAVAGSIRLLQRWGWDLLADRMSQRVRYHPGDRRAISAVAGLIEPAHLITWLAELAEAQRASDHPLNARLVVERLLLRYVELVTPRA
jgi:DNA polymerase III subunit delta'